MKKALLLFFLLGGVSASESDDKFRALTEQDWQFRLREYPELASSLGDARGAGLLTDMSQTALTRRLKALQATRAALGQIDLNGLDHNNHINMRIFADQIDAAINDLTLGGVYLPFNSDTQFWADWPRLSELATLRTPADYSDYLKRLRALPALNNQYIVLMRAGLKLGISQPRAVLTGRDTSIASQLVDNVSNSDFYQPFLHLPDTMSSSDQLALQARAQTIIKESVLPAYRDLLKFMQKEYFPKARTTLAATALPQGDAFYRAQIYQYTTLHTEPQTIHETGLAEVARIRSEMEAIRTQLNFAGDLPAFLNYLRHDPQFFAHSTHELLAEASYFSKKIDGVLPKYFSTLPRQPYGVVAVPDAIAPTYTTGRYVGSNDPAQAGFYWVNTSKLDQRPLWALPALTLHEAVPGHHLQGALAGEQGEQPPFRRYSYISAFGEGWGLYSEHLGVEMGIYETPYQQFGRLVYEMWRACRLVVDTGVHQLGWTREQAVAYLQTNTALSEHEINTEVDRYISWPGQALAYKLGEMKIRELRARAESKLGAKFDLREFHDTILKLGSVPLSVLEEEVDAWIAQRTQA